MRWSDLLFDAFDSGRRMRQQVERNFDEFGQVSVDDDVGHPRRNRFRQQSSFRLSAGVATQQSVQRPPAYLTNSIE